MLKFYVYSNHKLIKDNLNLKKAIKLFKETEAKDKSLGVEIKEESVAIDLLIQSDDKTWISLDYLQTKFKNNKLVTVNVMNILKKEFTITGLAKRI